MIRVILESLAARYRQVLEVLKDLTGEPIEVVHIVGGGTQNELLNQLAADAAGKPVITGPVEATVLGSVLMQAKAGGQIDSLDRGRKIIAQSFDMKEYLPQEAAKWNDYLKTFPKF